MGRKRRERRPRKAKPDYSSSKNGRTSLSFVTRVTLGRRGGWTVEKAVTYSEAVIAAGHVINSQTLKDFKEVTGMSVQACRIFYDELMEAFKRGYSSVEDYFEAGRPLRPGKKEIA